VVKYRFPVIGGDFFWKKTMQKIINIAVIAHVDHGKTTLVDAILKQCHVFRDNEEEMQQTQILDLQQTQILDRNELERERGITILAKNCAVDYKDVKINIIDTPGHADFSGEVERTLGMADGALLIVDAQEGPMPQTRFVLKKALELGLKIIVVINKIDKKFASPALAISKVESLFLELVSDQSQLDFPVLYAIGRQGAVYYELPQNDNLDGDVVPLLETIKKEIPESQVREGPFKMLVTSIDYDPHLGRIVVGKIHQGSLRLADKIKLAGRDASYSVEKLFVWQGLGRVEVDMAQGGEIVSFAGVNIAKIGDTVVTPADTTPLPSASIGEPTLHMTIGPNTSPFSGKEGKFVTSRQIEERLMRELETNLSLRVEKQGNGKFVVSGRGELHLSILLETMRREGYEMEVGKPEVIIKQINGQKHEPYEEVFITVGSEHTGVITEEFGKRGAILVKMEPTNDTEIEFIYVIPTRGLIGLRGFLNTKTKGTIVFSSSFLEYRSLGKVMPRGRRGALIASEAGTALGYGLNNAQGRGTTFIEPGVEVYEGMIVGVNAKDEDIAINVCKGKQLTNMRSKASDGVLQLTPATKLSLEQSLDFLSEDDLLEITPQTLRLRKKNLSELERKRAAKVSAKA